MRVQIGRYLKDLYTENDTGLENNPNKLREISADSLFKVLVLDSSLFDRYFSAALANLMESMAHCGPLNSSGCCAGTNMNTIFIVYQKATLILPDNS
jgi:hypothetical protein